MKTLNILITAIVLTVTSVSASYAAPRAMGGGGGVLVQSENRG